MAANTMFPDSTRRLSAILNQGIAAKQQVFQLAEKFVAGPESPLNGPLHPGFQPPEATTPNLVAPSFIVHGDTPAVPERSAIVAVDQSNLSRHPATSEVRTEEHRFREAMRNYEKTAQAKYKTGVNPDDASSLDQLWRAIDDEIERYESKVKEGVWGKVRQVFRDLGDKSEAVNSWLGLLPSQSHYLSIICGGCTLIIQAAARMRNVAEKVLGTLCKIPAILSGAKRVLQIYKNSEELRKLSDELYVSILTGLGHMIEYLRRKSLRKVFGAGFKQQSFESGMLAKIDDICNKRDAFNDEAEICKSQRLQSLEEGAVRSFGDLRSDVGNLPRILREENERAHQAIIEYNRAFGSAMVRMEKKIDDLPRKICMMLAEAPNAYDYVWAQNRRLDDPPAQTSRLRQLERQPSALRIATSKKSREVSAKQQRHRLLSQLDYDRDAAPNDVVANHRLGSDLSREEQGRGLFVIKASMLTDWIRADLSASIVVNGHAKRCDRKSGLSFRNVQGHPLYFFCGQHISREETWESPSGIVNSLLAQLLTRYKDVDISKVSRLGEFSNDDIGEVFTRFKTILKQLPRSWTVFCVVDAISFYLENDETAADAEWLVAELIEFAGRRSRKRASFKLLLTAPVRLRVPEECLGKSKALNIPPNLPATGGFTERQWTLGVGQELDSLVESD